MAHAAHQVDGGRVAGVVAPEELSRLRRRRALLVARCAALREVLALRRRLTVVRRELLFRKLEALQRLSDQVAAVSAGGAKRKAAEPCVGDGADSLSCRTNAAKMQRQEEEAAELQGVADGGVDEATTEEGRLLGSHEKASSDGEAQLQAEHGWEDDRSEVTLADHALDSDVPVGESDEYEESEHRDVEPWLCKDEETTISNALKLVNSLAWEGEEEVSMGEEEQVEEDHEPDDEELEQEDNATPLPQASHHQLSGQSPPHAP